MTLRAGRTLGHYEIVSSLGAGGMGEVYRARDTKLEREVAIKVLPVDVAADVDRLTRFRREAKSLAALNHPNVATLHGFEQDGETHFLVMELVEGETLAARIARGPMPAPEAIALFAQVAEGLEAAHGKGIVHRDLKPANIVVTADERVKILDFGLAKLVSSDADGAPVSAVDASRSPTLTAAATMRGEILGTAAYMSPEQARGKTVDERTDIWAFGVCLFEALTGRRLFVGETSMDVLSSVMTQDPSWDGLPADLPPHVVRALRRCLRRDQRQRSHHIADVRLELTGGGGDEAIGASVDGATAPARRRRGASRWWVAAVLASWAITGAMVWWFLAQRSAPPSELSAKALAPAAMLRAEISFPEGVTLRSDLLGAKLAISPDGAHLVYAGTDATDRHHLYHRRLDSFTTVRLDGTDGANGPFFSPDSEWVAFFTARELKKVSLSTGELVVLAPLRYGINGAWSEAGVLYAAHDDGWASVVPAGGGPPVRVGELESFGLWDPSIVPGDRALLLSQGVGDASRLIAVALRPSAEEMPPLALPTSEPILDQGYAPRVVVSGHLLYLRAADFFAVPIDLDSLATGAPARKVLANVRSDSMWGLADYAVSRTGTLVHVAGGDYAFTQPSWVDRHGAVEALDGLRPGIYNTLKRSPDGRHVVAQVPGRSSSLWLLDMRTAVAKRVAAEGNNSFPSWSHDGAVLYYNSDRRGRLELWQQRADGRGDARPLFSDEMAAQLDHPQVWNAAASPDGRYLVYTVSSSSADLWIHEIGGAAAPRPLLATAAEESMPAFSPNGRWLAHASTESGPLDVVVRPFPDVERAAWQVSRDGGFDQVWSPTGKELFYRWGNRLMRVRFSEDPDFTPQEPELVMERDFHDSVGFSFDVSADGERFLMNLPAFSTGDVTSISVVTNWFEELERLVPVD